jgi:hypothetical protein
MIILPTGKILQKALNRIYFPTTDQSERAAHNHILIKQVDTETTALTAFGQGGAWLERYVQGNGISGTKFLFRPKRIEDELNLTNLLKRKEYSNSSVAIVQSEAEVAFVSVKKMEGSEITKEGARNHFPLYEGEEEEEFGPPRFASTTVATIEASTFDGLVRDSSQFGSARYEEFSPVYFDLSENRIQILSSPELRAALLSRSGTAIVHSPFIFAVNAAYLRFLAGLGEQEDTIAIKYDEGGDIVTFEGSLGRVSLPIDETSRTYDAVQNSLLIINEERRPQIKEKTGSDLSRTGYRVVRLEEACNRIEVQQSHDQKLLIEATPTALEVKKVKDTRRKHPDRSEISVSEDYLECLDTDWVSLVVNFGIFLGALKVASTFVKRQKEASTDAITIELFELALPNGKKKYCFLLEPLSSPEQERFQLLYKPVPKDEVYG